MRAAGIGVRDLGPSLLRATTPDTERLRDCDLAVAQGAQDRGVNNQEAPMKPSLLIFSAVATVIAAVAASSSVAGHYGAVLPGFRSPSGNIKCYYNPKGLSSRGFTPVLRCSLDHADYGVTLQHRCEVRRLARLHVDADEKAVDLLPRWRLRGPPCLQNPRVWQELAARAVYLYLPRDRRNLPQPNGPRPVHLPPGLPHVVALLAGIPSESVLRDALTFPPTRDSLAQARCVTPARLLDCRAGDSTGVRNETRRA